MDKEKIELMLEEIYDSLNTKDWKNSTKKYVIPYKRYFRVIEMLDSFIETNNRFLAKRVVQEELYKIKGITETKCKKYKVNDGYCKKCDNIYCSLNKNN